jgi:hypothetical protein
VRAAILTAPTAELRQAGITESVMLDRERDLGLVGMVAIDSGIGHVLLRTDPITHVAC